MIEEQTREMIRKLFEQGKRKREIARFLGIDIKTVRSILTETPGTERVRSDKIVIDSDLLKQLYSRCSGYAQRVHEILAEEYGVHLGYSTLTRLLAEYEIARVNPARDERHPDVAGAEMQHDTSVYTVELGGTLRRVVCSGIYYRYSKMRYVVFYPRFDRFRLKCFLHEAFGFCGYVANTCIIDNTSLVVLYGSGANAVFQPEMIGFAQQYGFKWKTHSIRHANRKAGKERNFLTLQTNFFPGRRFSDLEDLNRQAFQWATERFASRPLSRTRLIPRLLFEEEKPHLLKVPAYVSPPYRPHQRTIDSYGYVNFEANYYWIPEGVRGEVTVLEYDKRIAVYSRNRKLLEYPLPPFGVKNRIFSPPDRPLPSRKPNNRRYGSTEERKRLRQMGEICTLYLDYIDSADCKVRYKQKLVRDLYRLSRRLAPELFLSVAERAVRYRIDSVVSLERIASQLIQPELPGIPQQPSVAPEIYEERESYKMGRFSSEADPSHFKRLLEEPPDE